MTESASPFIVIIRPEFMTFCHDACRAAALNHLLFRLALKCKNQPKEAIQAGEVLWYAKNEQITEEMANAWGVCKVGKEINELVAMNLLGRCKNPKWGQDRTKHFFFGEKQCQVLIALCEKHGICPTHLDVPLDVHHLIRSAMANDKSIKCLCPEGGANDKSIKCISANHPMHFIDPSFANDKSIRALPKNTTKIITEDSKVTLKEDSRERVIPDGFSPSGAHPLFSHPQYPFLLFDNLEQPSVMVLRFTPTELLFSSEKEDERRAWIADEIATNLEQQGYKVAVRYEHEAAEERVVEANCSGEIEQELPVAVGATSLTGRPDGDALQVRRLGSMKFLHNPSGERSTVDYTKAPSTPHASAHLSLVPGSRKDHQEPFGDLPTTPVPPELPGIEEMPTEPATKKSGKGGTRPPKPRVSEKEVEAYLDLFEALRRETTKNPEEGYGRTKKEKDAIRTLLKNNLLPGKSGFVTQERLRLVYLSLYNTPKDQRTGFAWADNMTIHAVCNHYADEKAKLTRIAQQKRQEHAQKQRQTEELPGQGQSAPAPSMVVLSPAQQRERADRLVGRSREVKKSGS